MAVNVSGGALAFESFIDDETFNRQIEGMKKNLQGLANVSKEQSSEMERFAKNAALAIGSYVSLTAGKQFITDVVKVRGEFQQLEVAFNTMLGSKEKADKLMAQVVQLAATTPFTLQDVAGGAKQLLAYGTEATKVTKTISMLGDIASGVGAPLNDIVYLYGTLQTQGRAYTKDIMQFTGRGIPIIAELAKQFGVTQEKVQGLVEAGKVGFPEVEKAFQSLTGTGGIFNNLMESQSKTLTGQVSNLEDAYSRFLNDIGKSQEGFLSDTISGLTYVVNNYQDVLDILEGLVIVYGSYKAAVIATTVVQGIQTAATKGYTIVEQLRYRALLLSEAAQKLLNKTMLANPYVAVTAAVAALVATLVIFGKQSKLVRTEQELIAEATEKVGNNLDEVQAKIQPYVEALKKANVSEAERVTIYNKLREISPEIVKGLTAETLSYDALNKNVTLYLDSLRQKIALEANSEALTASIKQEQSLKRQIELQKEVDKKNAAVLPSSNTGQFAGANISRDIANKSNLKSLEESLVKQQEISKKLGQVQLESIVPKAGQVIAKTNKQLIDEAKSIKEVGELISKIQEDYNSTTDEQQRKRLAGDLAYANARKKALDIVGFQKEQAKAGGQALTEEQKFLEQRLSLLQEIANIQRDAQASGLTKNASEIEQINQRYDEAIKKLTDYNATVDQFNKKNKANVQKISLTDIDKLNAARNIEVTNAQIKQDLQIYKEGIDGKEKLFADFQRIQLAGNDEVTAQAKKQYAEQLAGFETFISFIENELSSLEGKTDTKSVLQREYLAKLKTDIDKANSQTVINKSIEDFKKLLEASRNFNDQKKQLDKEYYANILTLGKTTSGKEFEERLRVLKLNHADELQELKKSLLEQSDAYKVLNQDIIFLTRERAEEQKKILQDTLKSGEIKVGGEVFKLTPEMIEQIKAGVKSLDDFIAKTNEVFGLSVEEIEKIASAALSLSGDLSSLATAIEPFNAGLADTLQTMSEIVGVAGNVSNAIASFASGNVLGGIGSTVSAVVGLFSLGKRARESEEKAKEEMKAFQFSILEGEIQINLQYRERLRMQQELNDLKIKGLNDEIALLEEQQKQSLEDYNTILALLQNESFVSGQTTEKTGGFLGIGRKTETVDILSSLAGKSFDELNSLFLTGQLTDSAAALFQQLQALSAEGADIEKAIADAKKELDEAFTGTTSDTILDSIVQGFADGKRATADFADNFEDLMKNAILNSLKFQALEKPLQDFYDQFAAFSQSDSQLTQDEITNLQNLYNSIIENAATQFEDLQNIAGIDFTSTAGSGNSLSGAIKGMTEDQAELLAGQFSGLRLTAIQQLNVMTQQLDALTRIDFNTSRLEKIESILKSFDINGIKIK